MTHTFWLAKKLFLVLAVLNAHRSASNRRSSQGSPATFRSSQNDSSMLSSLLGQLDWRNSPRSTNRPLGSTWPSQCFSNSLSLHTSSHLQLLPGAFLRSFHSPSKGPVSVVESVASEGSEAVKSGTKAFASRSGLERTLCPDGPQTERAAEQWLERKTERKQ